ncbi:hypothetical protein [Rheinheimera soli]|uniref:Uncharacterized protein n=1 Tax=Rheinheimera soli TaxID=443616 RepID=A0ABU1VUE7_9GAMM|nr:hypothetical protein [Rheinheimera soli]MDR7119307.1 hypothetical protein [Rheinheimera soli]
MGYPKAASTAFQDTMYQYHEQLKDVGIYYPMDLIPNGSTKHEELFQMYRLKRLPLLRKTLAKIFSEAKNCHTVVLSTESIANFFYQYAEDSWADFFNEFKIYGMLELVLVCRDYDSFSLSYYKQAVVNSQPSIMAFYSTSLFFSEFIILPDIQKIMNVRQLSKDLANASDSCVREFNYSSDVVQEIINWLGFDYTESKRLNSSNLSLTNEQVELIRQLNGICENILERNAWFYILNKCSSLTSTTAVRIAEKAKIEDVMKLNPNKLNMINVVQNSGFMFDPSELSRLITSIRLQIIQLQKM